jgi:CxxC-x17-CxxC domain-containing protein
MVLEDKTIICKDCAEKFLFSSGEQGFFLEKGLLNEPQRCTVCREERRRERALYHRTSTVVCAGCGSETTVPFVPRLNRPVYCDSCYKTARETTLAPAVRNDEPVEVASAPVVREEELVEATT